jgi:hypothetical protein
MPRGDRAIGIVAGIVLGLIVVALFVFVFSESTVDAPSIGGGPKSTVPSAPSPVPTAPARPPRGTP